LFDFFGHHTEVIFKTRSAGKVVEQERRRMRRDERL
jgi:hypothetical protein